VYGQNVVASQYANGQVVGGAVQTVQGAPIYVPQPYGVPYGVGVAGPAVAAALPWGLAALGGTEFDVDGDLFDGKLAGPNNEDFALATGEVGELDAISYDDAFSEGYTIGGALERDLNRNTTVFGQGSYRDQSGKTFANGTFTPGTYDAAGNFTATGATEDVTAELTDLTSYTAEVGLRRYMGGNAMFRPYVGASAGATYNESVDITQTSSGGTLTADANTFEYIESGWNPTAAGLLGAEMALGHRGAIGVESGVRWTDGLDTVAGGADSRISIPVKLRGRVAF
jgi:hypothetical protein